MTMKKRILKLLLASVFITSFSAHAVDIDRVLEATDSLSTEDQAEIIFKTAVVKAIDVNKALYANNDHMVLVLSYSISSFLLPFIVGAFTNDFINNRVPNSISHLNERSEIYNYKRNLKNLNRQHDRANRLMQKRERISGIISDYRDRINLLPTNAHSTEDMISNSIVRWKGELEEVNHQFNRISSGLEERNDVQKKLDAAKNELRLMQTKKGFFYKISRSAYRLKGAVIVSVTVAGMSIAVANNYFIISHSKEEMIRLQDRYKRDIESLINQSEEIFPDS